MVKKKPNKPIRTYSSTDLDEKLLNNIPLVTGVYITFRNEKELMKKRRFIYSVNSNNAAGRRWRTIRYDLMLLLLRIE